PRSRNGRCPASCAPPASAASRSSTGRPPRTAPPAAAAGPRPWSRPCCATEEAAVGRTLSRMTAPGALAQVRHVTPVRPRAARGLVAEVYAGLERDFGMLAPPVILHSPVP